MAAKKTAVSPLMKKLSAYIAGATKKSPPKEVIEKTKHHILDTLAAMVSGAKLKPGRVTLSYAKTLGGKPEATGRDAVHHALHRHRRAL